MTGNGARTWQPPKQVIKKRCWSWRPTSPAALAQAGADRAQVEYLRSEVARAQSRLESAQLRSPIAGIVVTPDLQNAAGEHLDAGAPFAQVLDLSSAVVRHRRSAARRRPAASRVNLRRSSWTAIRSAPGTRRSPSSAQKHSRAMANAPSPPAFRCPTPRHASRRNDRPRQNLHRLSTRRVCAAAPTRALDMANFVELDWLVTA